MTDVICSCDACRYISPLGKCTLLGIDIDERGQCMQFEEPYDEDEEDEKDEEG